MPLLLQLTTPAAQIHGFPSAFVPAALPPTLYGTWFRVHAIRLHLSFQSHIVFLDADAIFAHLELPLEWLFNYSLGNPAVLAARHVR